MNQYEAMFLFDPTFGTSFENCETEVRRILGRAEAEILICRRWDERRLAYKIKGRKRGVYVLVYFRAPPTKIGPLERDAQLSENILRVLVLRAEGLTPEAMEKAFTTRAAETEEGGESHRYGGRRPPRDDFPEFSLEENLDGGRGGRKHSRGPRKEKEATVAEAESTVKE